MRFKHSLVSQAGILLFCLLAVNGTAQTNVVTDSTEAALRAAMAGGGTLTFACDGTIMLTDTITNQWNTVLDGSGHNITISGGNAVRVLFNSTNTSLTLINLTIANGSSTNGAGIFNDGGQLTLSQVVFQGNIVSSNGFGSGPQGGGIFNAGGTVNATNCTFRGNQALGASVSPYSETDGGSGAGGAVANQGMLDLINCSFTDNAAVGETGSAGWGGETGYTGGNGAGGAVWNSGVLLVDGCTFAGNSAVGGTGGQGASAPPILGGAGRPGGTGGDGAGGALFNCGTASLVNCTLAFNTGIGGDGGAGGPGYQWSPDYPPGPSGPNGPSGLNIGGIYDASGQCYLTNCTVASNSGMGIWTTGTNGTKLINTLLAENSPDVTGAFVSGGHNLVGITNGSSGFPMSGDLVGSSDFPLDSPLDPMLGPLADNGGPTLTMALLPGWPAIDAGDNAAAPPADQRGFPRPVGAASDIGAYELCYIPVLQIGSPRPGTINVLVYSLPANSADCWPVTRLPIGCPSPPIKSAKMERPCFRIIRAPLKPAVSIA